MKIDIDPQTEANLKALAASGNVAPEDLAAAILAHSMQVKDSYWQERAEDMAAIAQYRQTGKGISQQDMNTKMDGMIANLQKVASQG